MMKYAHLLLFCLLATGSTNAQEPKEAPVPADQLLTEVTVILRHAGSNIPGKYTTYLSGARGHAMMPLHDPAEPWWVAEVTTRPGDAKQLPSFQLYIRDTTQLEARSSERIPLSQRAIQVIGVELPLRFGDEILVYKAPNLSVSILFQLVSK